MLIAKEKLVKMGIAIFITFLWYVGYWIEDDKSKFYLGRYKTWIDNRNPLYMNGYFRKCSGKVNKHLLLAGPKWLFLCEVYSIFLIVSAWTLAIYSVMETTDDLVWEVFTYWNLVSLIITGLVREHYRTILKRN